MSEEPCTAPGLFALRCVFGVGDPLGGALFCPVYSVALPVAQPDALDDDDVHEFAAADLLADLQRRATRRGWSMRVEVEVEQTAADAASCDVYAQGPEEATALQLLAQADAPGGGRRLTFGTGLAHTPEAVVRLAGPYVVQHAASPPTAVAPARACSFELGFTEYEFEA
ncbi:hypothetical protein [Nannocystis bainbridge]|uniref:Uncharacterized protein n=1 Tax=Nannocystis bainbridge TaxID=2995303 RepID=A0ABT5DZ26_9BACT|nr:hypothetical protein [Nannocystis bainbridge]MDC0717706.1 hypothetical protein [Nannocystis bainbridge]